MGKRLAKDLPGAVKEATRRGSEETEVLIATVAESELSGSVITEPG